MSTRPSVMRSSGGGWDRSQRLLAASTLLSVLLWFMPGVSVLVYPIRLLVTFVHEGAHAAAAALTGGTQIAIAVFPNGSGYTVSTGGNNLLVIMAGYLGAMAFGAITLLWSRQVHGRTVLATMLACVGLIAALWVRNGFGLAAAAGIALILIALMQVKKRTVADFVAAFLSVQLCLNALLDLRVLLAVSAMPGERNDAAQMAQVLGFTPWFWAAIWALLGAAMLAASLRAYWSGRPSTAAW